MRPWSPVPAKKPGRARRHHSWTDGQVGARNGLTLDFTTCEKLVGDRGALVDRLRSLSNGDRQSFGAEGPSGTRRGRLPPPRRRIGERREGLTPQQIALINRLIPDRQWDTFRWEL